MSKNYTFILFEAPACCAHTYECICVCSLGYTLFYFNSPKRKETAMVTSYHEIGIGIAQSETWNKLKLYLVHFSSPVATWHLGYAKMMTGAAVSKPLKLIPYLRFFFVCLCVYACVSEAINQSNKIIMFY